MGQYYDADQVCHFRHCGHIVSKAPGPGSVEMRLTASSSASAWTGGLVCTESQESANSSVSQYFWLLTDRPGHPQEDDIGYVALSGTYALESSPHSSEEFHNVRVSSTLGSQATIAITSNLFDSSEQLCFVSHGDDGFAIMLPGTNYCLTAGTAPAATISSSSVGVYVTTYTGAKTQLWDIRLPTQLVGCYQIAPAAGPEMAILSPGQGIANQNPVGIGAYEHDDITATWYAQAHNSIAFPTPGSYLNFFSDRDAVYLYRDSNQAGATAIQRTQREDFSAFGTLLTYQRELSSTVSKLSALNGSWYAKQYLDSISGSANTCLSSADGSTTIGQNLKFATINTSIYDDNITQFFFPIPRNLYDSTLPQCHDVQLILHDNLTGDERILSKMDIIDPSADITLIPRFICESDQYVATLRIAFSEPSGVETSEWSQIVLPTSGNYPKLAGSNWGIPSAGQAWGANCFAAAIDDDGYTTTTEGFDFSSGLFSGHSGEIAYMTLTISSFAMETHGSQKPWMPCVSRTSSVTYRIAAKPAFSITSATIDENFVTLSGNVTSGWLGGGQMTLDIEDMEWTYIQGSPRRIPHALIDYQSLKITESAFSAKIPLIAFSGDECFKAIELMHSGRTVSLHGTVSLVSPYGTTTLSVSPPVSWPASTTADDVTYLNVTQHAFYTKFSTPLMYPADTQLDWTTSYVVSKSETGSRLVKLLSLIPSDRIALFPSGSELPDDSIFDRALIFRRLRDDFDHQLFYQTWEKTQSGFSIASISYHDTAAGIVKIIPLEGNVTSAFSQARQVTRVQRLGSMMYTSSTNRTRTPELKFTGTFFRHAVASSDSSIEIYASVERLYRIPPEAICTLRTSHGTAHQVMITSIDSPRSIAGLVQVTINMIEVES